MTGSDHDGHGLPALLDREVDLGGRAAVRASRSMVGRLGVDASGRFLLEIPLFLPFRRPSPRLLVGTADSGVDAHISGDQAFASDWACGSVKTRFRVPSRCNRLNRSWTRPHGPYYSGISCHGVPARVRHRILLTSCRRVHIGGRPGFFPLGESSSSRAHCSSVRSPRATVLDLFAVEIHLRDGLDVHHKSMAERVRERQNRCPWNLSR